MKPVVIVVAVACVAASFALPAKSGSADAERYIVDSERQWAESVASGDAAIVERILADDFIGVSPEGKHYSKAEMVADTRDAPRQRGAWRIVAAEDLIVPESDDKK